MWNELLHFSLFVKYIFEHFHYAFSTIIMFYGFVYLRLRLWCFNWVANSSFTRKLSQSYFYFEFYSFVCRVVSLTFLQCFSAADAKCVLRLKNQFSFFLYEGHWMCNSSVCWRRGKKKREWEELWSGTLYEWRKAGRNERKFSGRENFCKSLTAGIFMRES